MTIISIDGVSLAEKLEPLFRIGLSLFFGFIVYIFIRMVDNLIESEKRRKRFNEAKQLYTARKRKFEGNELGWKKWRDANYKITDLVEADSYY